MRVATVAARQCPRDPEALALLGELQVLGADPQAARVSLERARALAPDSRDARLAFHLGFARAAGGDLEGSLREYLRADALGDPAAYEPWLLAYDIGDDLMALGRLDDAIDAYRRAVRSAPLQPMPHFALGVALDRAEQPEASRVEIDTGLALDPQLQKLESISYVFVPASDAYYYRALIHLAQRRPALARDALRAYLAAAPDGAYSARARQHLDRASSQVDALQQHLQR